MAFDFFYPLCPGFPYIWDLFTKHKSLIFVLDKWCILAWWALYLIKSFGGHRSTSEVSILLELGVWPPIKIRALGCPGKKEMSCQRRMNLFGQRHPWEVAVGSSLSCVHSLPGPFTFPLGRARPTYCPSYILPILFPLILSWLAGLWVCWWVAVPIHRNCHNLWFFFSCCWIYAI